ncbi:beta-lactamase-like protein [Rhizophagus irregularis DAOM 181602=DAOM 197198]|nr:beta-lactamase-like protein [Rhizophagus irregularis DAOM 181602=DAOM 197198]
MKLIVDYILLTFENFPSCDIIGSKAQQHSSVSVEVSSNISNHSDHTSSSNDAISENKENDKKRRKLDHLIDSTGDDTLPYITEYTSFKGKITLQSLHVLKSRTHSQLGFTNIFTGVTADWNVARSLYSIADIQSCIDKVRPVGFGENLNLYELEVTAAYGSGYCNWMIDCGGEKISIVDLRDKDGARFETILIEIEIVLPTL